jgi:ABC-type phosphate transport system permease subunit
VRALVRPAITFGLFAIFLFVELFGCWYAYYNGVDFKAAVELLWTPDTQVIWGSILGFWFGTR